MLRALRLALYPTLALALAGGAAWLLCASPWLRYQSLEIVGNNRASVAHLRHLANLQEGEPLVLLDLDEAVAGVRRHPWVRDASATRLFPTGVRLAVEERVPVALVQLDGLFLVDAEGVVFTRAQAGDFDYPVLTGFDAGLVATQPEVGRRLVREGLDWLAAAQAQGGLQESELSELRFDMKTGYTLTLRNGGQVLLGFAGKERVARLALLTAQGLDRSAPQRVDLVSERLAVVTPL